MTLKKWLVITIHDTLATRIGFKKEMSKHPCFAGEDKDSVYLYFDEEEEKEETINYLTNAFKRRGVKTQIKRCT